MRPTSKLFGLIGKKLRHSYSPQIFAEIFAAFQPVCKYRRFEVDFIHEIRNLSIIFPHLRGFNVTVPYKTEIIPFLDEISEAARAIGAVNVVSIRADGAWLGDNTDALGFAQTLGGRVTPSDGALILGTGGAAKAVRYALEKYVRLARIDWVSRGNKADALAYAELAPEMLGSYRLIINATPLGTFPDVTAAPPLPYHALTPAHFLYDLVYNPAQTRFLQHGAQAGAETQNGLAMLYGQAQAAWEIWKENLW